MDDSGTIDRDQLRSMLGDELADFADHVPDAMARELLHGDHGFVAPYQLSAALLSRLTPAMRDWQTADVLRAIYPATPLSRTRMQPIAGALAAVACRTFPGFCHFPYIPVAHMAEGRDEAPLIVAVHGSSRNAKDLRDGFATFAERLGCFVLAPLFPMELDMSVPDEGYKQLVDDRWRYDHILWAMVDELSAAARTRFSAVLLFGFSGGAQFAQRLLYVDPGRLAAVALGAPSYVTLPSERWRWWSGLGDFQRLFGKPVDWPALRRVPVHIQCGTEDRLDCAIYSAEEMGLDAAAHDAFGRNRIDRARLLHEQYGREGVASRLTLISGAAHAWGPHVEVAKPFFEEQLVRAASV
nr:hypothetical protein [Sphingomonas sp. Y57]